MVWWGKHCLCCISCYNSHRYGIWSYHCFPTWICPLIASWMEGYGFCGTYCYMSSKMVPEIVYFVFFHPLTSKNSNSDWALISTKFENFLTSKLSLYDVLFFFFFFFGGGGWVGGGEAYAYNIFRLTWLVGPFCVGYSIQICNKSCRLAWTCQCSLELFLF